MKAEHIQHLYWRAGFGILPNKLNSLRPKSKAEVIGALFKESSSFSPLLIDTTEFDEVIYGMSKPSKAKLRDLLKKSREKSLELNIAWIDRLTNSKELLRERMTLFWANHFVCEDKNIVHIQQYNNTLRRYALGNFGDFLKAVSKEASMIKYLNNKQNRKEKPNENFARELLELFTLGNGNYVEQDIKEAARAFTGWNNTIQGKFKFRKFQHDFDSKVFLGESGNFDGDEIIDLILKQKQCARFICKKVYSYFVNERVNEGHINEMVRVFYPNYNIEDLMRCVFLSDWFYKIENIGSKIKSPIELYVGISNIVPVEFNNDRGLYYIQKLLNQVLLRPPNVAGWKGGKTWIDSNTIMIRLKLASILLNNAVIALEERGEFEDSYQMYYQRMRKRKRKLETSADWNSFEENYKDLSIEELESHLILSTLNNGTKEMLSKLQVGSKKEYCVQLMSLPEYQMC